MRTASLAGGSQVGAGAVVSPAALVREFDLVTIGPGAVLDACTVRAFAVDQVRQTINGALGQGGGCYYFGAVLI